MIEFEAICYDGVHPTGEPVSVRVADNGRTSVVGIQSSFSCHWMDIEVTGQLGRTARSLKFPNGAKCESHAHGAINRLQDQYTRSTFGKILHALESHWHYVLIASIIIIAFTWGMITHGIPGLANRVALALPASVDEGLSKGSLELLDQHILSASELNENHRQRLQNKFAVMAENSNDAHDYRLLFRRGVGPNAFALPSGHIVVTDELIELADHDDEVLAVLAHEIGHVVHKHGLRSVLQSSAVALLLTAVTGDIGSASGFAAAMPIILLETNYSRRFEREADQYAYDYMRANDFNTKHFAVILKKITGEHGDDNESVFTYLSTHPSTSDRTRRFTESRDAND